MLFLTIEFLSRDVKGPFVAKIDTQAFKLYGIPRDCVQDAINKLDKNLQGIYFLVNTEERGKGRYLYIGQTKQGPERLIDHRVKKPEWNMAYMFLASKTDLSLQTVDELEALEIQRFSECGKFSLFNTRPNLAEPSPLTQLFSEGMKRNAYLLPVALLGIVLAGCSSNSVSDETLVVGLECNYAPFNWTENAANSYTLPIANHAGSYADGYDIQIAKMLAEKTGKKVEIRKMVWESLVPDLQAGNINCIIAGMTDTEEREKSMDFTAEYYRSELVLVTKKRCRGCPDSPA